MRKINNSVNSVISEIEKMKGENVNMEINRGRNKVEKITGIIKDTFPGIFTVIAQDGKNHMSYSYTEVLCGDIVIEKKQE